MGAKNKWKWKTNKNMVDLTPDISTVILNIGLNIPIKRHIAQLCKNNFMLPACSNIRTQKG